MRQSKPLPKSRVEFGGGNDGLTNADVEIIHGIFIRDGANVDDHIGNVHAVCKGFFRGGHEMDRLGSDDTGDIVPVSGADQHFAGHQGVFVPAAQGQKTQAAIGLDGVDDEAHLVGMGVDHQHRSGSGVFLAVDIEIAQEILFQLSDGRRILPGDGNHFVFKAGSTGGIR